MGRKKAFISGAASGIGKATAERFASEGWDLFITDINEAGLRKVLRRFPWGSIYAVLVILQTRPQCRPSQNRLMLHGADLTCL